MSELPRLGWDEASGTLVAKRIYCDSETGKQFASLEPLGNGFTFTMRDDKGVAQWMISSGPEGGYIAAIASGDPHLCVFSRPDGVYVNAETQVHEDLPPDSSGNGLTTKGGE